VPNPTKEYYMILKKGGLEIHEFTKLIDFLDWETEDNVLYAEKVVEGVEGKKNGFRPVFIAGGRELNCLSPFCKLVGVKSSYDRTDALNFDVVVEIPDKVYLTWIPNNRDGGPTQEKGEVYIVDTDPFLIMLNAVFGGGEEPKEALKRLTLYENK
jgi:hypothetical protein